MLGKKCKNPNCNNEAMATSRYCRDCRLSRKREQAKERYKKNGRRTYTRICEACGCTYLAGSNKQRFCKNCYKESRKTGYIYNDYERAGGGGYCFRHRKIAEGVLNRKLNTNEVVHHLNCIETDNDLRNLVVMSRSKHSALHEFLRQQRVILAKACKENFENCWKNSIIPMTTTWLETANVKVEKLWELSQSAAEPPNVNLGEGSETMYEAPEMGEDIVQTTTSQDGLGDKK